MFKVAVYFISTITICLSLSANAFAQFSYELGQTDDGLRYIRVDGAFPFDPDISHFNQIVRQHDPAVVVFNSPGGNPFGAMALGRQIRAAGLATFQFRGSECASACTFAFMGGVMRFAEAGSLGVHRSSYSEGLSIGASDAIAIVQQHTAEIMSYMIEMGVDPSLMQLAMSYDADDIRYLSRSEMERYRVVTIDPSAFQEEQTPQATIPSQQPQASIAPPPRAPNLTIPEALSGRVLHPAGRAELKQQPATDAVTLSPFFNGDYLKIHQSRDRWYYVTAGGRSGWLHHSWVFVDQFQSGPFAQRHVQIKSFENYQEAEAYIRSSSLPLRAYLATNGWIAITLDATYSQDEARDLILGLKERALVPDDSFITYGNTYARKVCCE